MRAVVAPVRVTQMGRVSIEGFHGGGDLCVLHQFVLLTDESLGFTKPWIVPMHRKPIIVTCKYRESTYFLPPSVADILSRFCARGSRSQWWRRMELVPVPHGDPKYLSIWDEHHEIDVLRVWYICRPNHLPQNTQPVGTNLWCEKRAPNKPHRDQWQRLQNLFQRRTDSATRTGNVL